MCAPENYLLMWMRTASEDAHGVVACSGDAHGVAAHSSEKLDTTILSRGTAFTDYGATCGGTCCSSSKVRTGQALFGKISKNIVKGKKQVEVWWVYHIREKKSHIHVFVQKDIKSHLAGCTPNSCLEKRRGTLLRIMCKNHFTCICNALKILRLLINAHI